MDKNMTLEKRIDAELYSYQGRMSVLVDDLQGHTVERGADEEFETASVIKAFLLAALYLQAERGKADLSAEIEYEASQFVDGSGMLRALGVGARLKVKDTATMMIICSDNIATNMLIDYLGLDTINACIRELGFAHTVLHNALHFDRYRQLGTTTPRDYASLLAQMARGTLVSKAASVEMLAILRQQHYNTMLTKDFPQYYLDCEETGAPELLWVASKSGSMNDSSYRTSLLTLSSHERIARIVSERSLSSSQPSIAAPSFITSLEHPAANFLSLNFFFRLESSISFVLFEGRILAAAPMSPVSSSVAKSTFSISCFGSTSQQIP